MRTLLTIGILFFAILNGNTQPMEKDFWLWAQRDTLRTPPIQKPYELVIVPRPQSIHMRGNKVVVVYPKREWMEAQRINRMRVKRMEMMMRRRSNPNKR